MSDIKIFVDCHVFDDGFQGTTTYLQGLYSELIKDYTKHFFLAASDIPNLQKIFGTQENITYLAYNSHNKFKRLLLEIPRLVKKHNIDFAHFQYIVSPIKRCKYIVTTHDVLFLDFPQYFPTLNRIKNEFLYKWSIKKSDIVFTVSEYSKRKIIKHFRVENIYITTNAVSDEFFKPYDKEKVKEEILKKYGIENYLICVSRWEPRKRHDLILRSFIDLKLYKDHHLVFIGDVTFANKEYEEIFKTLDDTIKSKIFAFKKVKFKDMLEFLRGAKVSIYPSLAEGFGIPPLESLAAKIPTITSNATAMSDFDFLKEYSFDPGSKEDFEKKLLKALTAGEYEIEKLRSALKMKYNWKSAAESFELALEKKES